MAFIVYYLIVFVNQHNFFWIAKVIYINCSKYRQMYKTTKKGNKHNSTSGDENCEPVYIHFSLTVSMDVSK